MIIIAIQKEVTGSVSVQPQKKKNLVVMFFRPILRNQLFRIFQFRLFLNYLPSWTPTYDFLSQLKKYIMVSSFEKVNIHKSEKVDFLGLIQRT